MSKTIETSKDYKGYKVCSESYTLKTNNMRDILSSLIHSRDTLNRPIAIRYTVGLEEDHSFDIKKLTRKIKAAFRKEGYSFIYSFEHAERKGLHLEMMLIIDQSKRNPTSVYSLLKGILSRIEGVKRTEYDGISINFHKRMVSDTETNKTGHSLKDAEQFIDCVYRASYLSKQDDKEQVQYRKTFGTTRG